MNSKVLEGFSRLKKSPFFGPKKIFGISGGVLAVVLVSVILWAAPAFISADDSFLRINSLLEEELEKRLGDNFIFVLDEKGEVEEVFYSEERLPENNDREVEYIIKSDITAYNSEVAQCNEFPCITANGYNLCTTKVGDTVAANHLPFGTKIRIPEYFGDKVFVVRDRMNARYSNRIDVWMERRGDAIQFGIKRAEVEILK